MASHHFPLFLFFLLLATTSISTTPSAGHIRPPSPPTITTNQPTPLLPPPLPPSLSSSQDFKLHNQQQLDNIIDALIGAGDFYSWANVLSAMSDPSTLPISATLFIPADDSLSPTTSTVSVDPFIFPYHIVPQRLTFSDLCQFKLFSRLPTLLPAKTILITNTSLSNFTLDGTLLSHPDLYTTSTIVVHGISDLLDYSVYGEPPSQTQTQVASAPPPSPSQGLAFVPSGELIGATKNQTGSEAACLCSEVWTVFLVFFVALASKILRINLGC